jgi:hypothetical protein
MLRRTTVLGAVFELEIGNSWRVWQVLPCSIPVTSSAHNERMAVVEDDMMKSSASDELNVSSSSGQTRLGMNAEVAVPGKGSND